MNRAEGGQDAALRTFLVGDNMTDSNLHFIDNSTLSAVKRCALNAHYRYEMHWTQEARPIYFDFGSAWHSAQDELFRRIPEGLSRGDAVAAAYNSFVAKWVELGRNPNPNPAEIEETTPRTPGIAREMLTHYVEKRYDWIQYKIKVLAIEEPFVVPLDSNDPTLFYVGRLDKIIEDDSGVWVVEHKTTTDYRVDGDHFSSQFIESFNPNSQVDGYSHAIHMRYGSHARGVLVDAAMVHKKVHDAFRLIPSYRSIANIDAWRQEALFWARSWLRFKELGFFPKNTNNCVDQYRKICPYIGTCRTHGKAIRDLEAPMGMKVEKWEPFDLSILTKAAKEVLQHAT